MRRRRGAETRPASARPCAARRSRPVRPRASRRAGRRPGATCAASADGPTQRIAAPPSRTSGRHHSAAVGGWASAFATATPPSRLAAPLRDPRPPARSAGRTVSGSRTFAARRRAGRPRDPGGRARAGSPAHRRRSRRRRAGRRTRRTSSRPASESSRRTRRAAAGSRRDVRPGVEARPRARRQASGSTTT